MPEPTPEPSLENFVWLDKEGSPLKMLEMDEKHLQYAHTHACLKEFHHHNMGSLFCNLRDQIEAIAEHRGIKLYYPDETHPSPKFGKYFCTVRQNKKVAPIRATSFDKYRGLEQVNSL